MISIVDMRKGKLMGKLIDQQVAIDAVLKESNADGAYGYMDTKSIVDLLNDLPSAQPEIIRCKDCKWWSNDDYRECSSPNYDDGYITPAGFYCGYAERRTDERTD